MSNNPGRIPAMKRWSMRACDTSPYTMSGRLGGKRIPRLPGGGGERAGKGEERQGDEGGGAHEAIHLEHDGGEGDAGRCEEGQGHPSDTDKERRAQEDRECAETHDNPDHRSVPPPPVPPAGSFGRIVWSPKRKATMAKPTGGTRRRIQGGR